MEIHKNNYEIVYVTIVYIYIILGISYMGIEKAIPRNYVAIIGYFLFKMVTGYDKCTLSYIECKLRHVKKEDSYIYDFLHSIISLKNTPHKVYLYAIACIFIVVYFKRLLHF
jgi:hypothetical protein